MMAHGRISSLCIGSILALLWIGDSADGAPTGPSQNEVSPLDYMNLSQDEIQYLRKQIKELLALMPPQPAVSEFHDAELSPQMKKKAIDNNKDIIWDHQSYPSRPRSQWQPQRQPQPEDQLLAAILAAGNSPKRRASPSLMTSRRAYPLLFPRSVPRAYPVLHQADGLEKQLGSLLNAPETPAAEGGGKDPVVPEQSPSSEAKAQADPGENSANETSKALKEVSDHLTAAMIKAKTNGIAVEDLVKYFNQQNAKTSAGKDSTVKRSERTTDNEGTRVSPM